MDPSAEPSTVAEDPVAALRRELDSVNEKIRALEGKGHGKEVVAATDVKQEVGELKLRLDSLSTENAGLKERIQALEVKKEKKKKKKKKKIEKEAEQGEEEQGEESTFHNWRSNLRSQMTMVFPYLLLFAVFLICRMK
jgi:hypothetical protein